MLVRCLVVFVLRSSRLPSVSLILWPILHIIEEEFTPMMCSRRYICKPTCKIRQIKSPKESKLLLSQAYLIPSCKRIEFHVIGFVTEIEFVWYRLIRLRWQIKPVWLLIAPLVQLSRNWRGSNTRPRSSYTKISLYPVKTNYETTNLSSFALYVGVSLARTATSCGQRDWTWP